jgi:hypothetical protein
MMKSASPSSLSRLKNFSSYTGSSDSSKRNAGKITPNKRPLTTTTPLATPNHNVHNHNYHNNSLRLRSPKGSSPFLKRNNVLTWLQQLRRVCPRCEPASLLASFVVYTVLLFILFTVAYTTIQEQILGTSPTDNLNKNLLTSSVIPAPSDPTDSTFSPFDTAIHHVIPKSIYMPKSSNPISVIYIGRSLRQEHHPVEIDETIDQDILLDALQRSAYTKVMMSYLYSTNNITHPMHLLYQQQYHYMNSLNRKQPLVFVVDWSALLRDCHVLQRIVYHILRNSYFTINNKNNVPVFMLLLDASASSQPIICHNSSLLEQLIPNSHQNIRLAKRSIITNRRYNYTKEWIESGNYITNPITTSNTGIHSFNHILHWSGYVSQSFVQLLDIAVDDSTTRSKKRDWRRRRQQQRYLNESHNIHRRPIDVTHYWKAVTMSAPQFFKNEYHYYYNRLRQTVQQQIQTTRQERLKQQYTSMNNFKEEKQKQEELNDKRWVEFVGIDTQVEFVQSDSSADGSDANSKDDQDMDMDDMDESFARSSVHVAVLASSKIVVLTQADEYEDHDTRLFEALASGAMVLCDSMIAPPSGLVHKTNIVFFDSASKLDKYIQYYLDPENDMTRQEIARHGVEYALGRHRSWHVLEALLFGKALTRTDKHPLTDMGPQRRMSSVNDKYPVLISLK